MISSDSVNQLPITPDQTKESGSPNLDLPADKAPPKKKDNRSEIWSTLAVIILAPIVALFLTLFVFQSYEVDGPSMEKTLFDNDRLIVNKVGRTMARVSGKHYVPSRYSIIVFTQQTSSYEGTEEKQLIKRVIGLPGDRVVVKDGIVTVYNKDRPEGFNVDKEGPEAGLNEYTDGNIDIVIKPGQLYVLGDNRKNSLDSRAFGPIDSDAVIGTLSARIFPFNEIEKF